MKRGWQRNDGKDNFLFQDNFSDGSPPKRKYIRRSSKFSYEPSFMKTTISNMMYAFGDCRNPSPESVEAVEQLLQDQIDVLMEDVLAAAFLRMYPNCPQKVTHEDILFVMRRNKVKLKRFLEYVKILDSKRRFETQLGPGAPVENGKNVQACLDFLATIEDCEEFTSIMNDKTIKDYRGSTRMKNKNEKTELMDAKEYETDYAKAVQASFCPNQRKKEFLAWLSTFIDYKLTDFAVTILSYLARETVAEIVELALLIKDERREGRRRVGIGCIIPYPEEFDEECGNPLPRSFAMDADDGEESHSPPESPLLTDDATDWVNEKRTSADERKESDSPLASPSPVDDATDCVDEKRVAADEEKESDSSLASPSLMEDATDCVGVPDNVNEKCVEEGSENQKRLEFVSLFNSENMSVISDADQLSIHSQQERDQTDVNPVSVQEVSNPVGLQSDNRPDLSIKHASGNMASRFVRKQSLDFDLSSETSHVDEPSGTEDLPSVGQSPTLELNCMEWDVENARFSTHSMTARKNGQNSSIYHQISQDTLKASCSSDCITRDEINEAFFRFQMPRGPLLFFDEEREPMKTKLLCLAETF